METIIDLKQLALRLGQIIARKPNGRKNVAESAGISLSTLDRYLSGKSPRIPALQLAAICERQTIEINWLFYGSPYRPEKTSDLEKEVATIENRVLPRLLELANNCEENGHTDFAHEIRYGLIDQFEQLATEISNEAEKRSAEG